MPNSVSSMAERSLFPGFRGTEVPEWVRRRAQQGLGGVVLYSRNVESPEQLQRLCAALHAERPELLIAIDEEGGDVTRLEAAAGSSYPGNLALGAAGDPDLTRSVAASMGAELAAAGIDFDLAPDADVNSNPSNPVIGVRSFGSDARLVAVHTKAWIEGLQSSGVAACAKHFPGHGDTSVDSHLELPVVDEDPHVRALEPFKASILAGVRAMMSAHIVVKPIDSVPATVSSAIMTALLRQELGFDGLVITDGLEMRGLASGFGVAGGAVRALAAGCDALCIGGGLADEDIVDETHAAIMHAVQDGGLTEQRLADAASRVDALAGWRSRHPGHAAVDREVGLVAARRAMRVEGPVQVGGEVIAVQLSSTRSIAAGAVPWGVAPALAERGVRVTTIEATDAFDVEPVLVKAAGRSLVLVVRNLHRHAWQSAVADAILARRPDTVVVEMGLPACRPAAATAYISTCGAARVCGAAAAEVMRPR